METVQEVLERVGQRYPALSAQLKQAAKWILDHPNDVAVNSMRGLASIADVTPTTMSRLARHLGHANYDDFRRIFQVAVSDPAGSFAKQAVRLQQVGEGNGEDTVIADLAAAATANVENLRASLDQTALVKAADLLRQCDHSYVISAGALHWISAYFQFVARMAIPTLHLPRASGTSIVDDLLQIKQGDVALALSFAPYAKQSIESAQFARRRGATVISVTDSLASPLANLSEVLILVPTESPQFFPSMVAVCCALEILIAVVVSRSDRLVVEQIAKVDDMREREGLYWKA